MKYAVVVGAVNIDIGGAPKNELIPRDSNPGKITTSLGGVGRNIAHNMRLLGLDVRFVTALGDDDGARRVLRSCVELGIDASPSLVEPEASTSMYLFITNRGGDMVLAVSDMEVYRKLTPAFLETRLELLCGAELVMIDANIPRESIAWLAERCSAPVFCDPVSVSKAGKLDGLLGNIHTLKPNRIEAELLSGTEITDGESLAMAAETLLDTGLSRVFISLGGNGMYAAERGGSVYLPSPPTNLVNATGGGDAAMAALAWAYTKGKNLNDSAAAALAAGSIAVECRDTINPRLTVEAIKTRKENIK